jgi:DNA-binding MarR family transcriptional regulator
MWFTIVKDDGEPMPEPLAAASIRPGTATEAERDQLIATLASLSLPLMWALRQRARQIYEPFGVRPTRVLLMELVDHGTDRPKALAEMLEAVPPAVTAMANELAAKGWLTRESDPEDRRGIRLRLTPAGRDALGAMRSAAHDANRAWLDRLEIDHLRSVLHIFGELLEARS